MKRASNTALKRRVNKRLEEDSLIDSPNPVSCCVERTFDGGFELVELDGFDEMLGEAGL